MRSDEASPARQLDRAAAEADAKMFAKDLHAFFGRAEVLKGITIPIASKKVTAVIGPSGCGKSTFIR